MTIPVDFSLMFGMNHMNLPCGGVAYFDYESGNSYRCNHCGAVVGSMGMPKHCKDEADRWEMIRLLGGKDWDYFAEPEV